METMNRVLNILVLVAAAVAVVLGFLLFQGREDRAQIQQMMGQSISESVDTQNKGLSAAEKSKLAVSADDFAMGKNADQVQSALKKSKESTKLAVEREKELAGTISVLTEIASPGLEGAGDVVDFSLTAEARAAKRDEAGAYIHNLVKSRKAVDAGLANVASALKVEIDTAAIAAEGTGTDGTAKLDAGFAKVAERGRELDEKKRELEMHVGAVSSAMGSETITEFSPENLKLQLTELEETMNAYKTALNDVKTLTEAKEELETAKSELEEEKKTLTAKVAAVEKEMEEQKAEVARLTEIIEGKPEDKVEETVAQQTANSLETALNDFELLKKLTGKVVSVDLERGIVFIDLGTINEMEVKEADGAVAKKKVRMPPNAVLTVASTLSSDNPVSAGKIQITDSNDTHSVANICRVANTRAPQVGDVVYFSSKDLKTVREENEKRLAGSREKADQARQERIAAAQAAAEAAAEADDASVSDLLGTDDDAGADKGGEDAADDEESEDDEVF